MNASDSYGKNAKTTLRDVMALYEQAKIFEPSPTRLLRLANGRRCEFGPCRTVRNIAQRAVTNDGDPTISLVQALGAQDGAWEETNKVNKSRPDWGVYSCWNCLCGRFTEEVRLGKRALKAPVTGSAEKITLGAVVDDPRTAQHRMSGKTILFFCGADYFSDESRRRRGCDVDISLTNRGDAEAGTCP